MQNFQTRKQQSPVEGWDHQDPEEAFTLPSRYFFDETLFKAERDNIFMHAWHVAGHVSEFAEPGQYVVKRLSVARELAPVRLRSSRRFKQLGLSERTQRGRFAAQREQATESPLATAFFAPTIKTTPPHPKPLPMFTFEELTP